MFSFERGWRRSLVGSYSERRRGYISLGHPNRTKTPPVKRLKDE